jgi:DNA-binding XRE family transcriptional regulator
MLAVHRSRFISGSALLELRNEARNPIASEELLPEEQGRALWELGLRHSPTVAKKPEKPKAKPQYPPGLEVEKYRRALGLTQQELAEKMGLSRPVLSAVENGQAPLTRISWTALANAFGVLSERLSASEWQAAIE